MTELLPDDVDFSTYTGAMDLLNAWATGHVACQGRTWPDAEAKKTALALGRVQDIVAEVAPESARDGIIVPLHDGDDGNMASFYIVGEALPAPSLLAFALADMIANCCVPDARLGNRYTGTFSNFRQMLDLYGEAAATTVVELVRGGIASLRLTTVRKRTYDDDYGSILDADWNGDEWFIDECAADAECASSAWMGALDDGMAGLVELIEERDRIAVAVLRGTAQVPA